MRIDKYLASIGLLSRRQAKDVFKTEEIFVNNQSVTDCKYMLKTGDIIQRYEQTIPYKPVVLIVLNKPIGYVSSDVPEGRHKSYRDLLDDCVYVDALHVAGRLDADTTGLVLITNDGDLNHRIISPKKKMVKVYEVELEKNIHDADIRSLEQGVTLNDGYLTLPAQVEKVSERKIILSIHEGKYHQVKRMMEAIDNKVIKLHRSQVGNCKL